MAAFAEGLAAREVATLRFQFPYMERARSAPTCRPSRRPRSAAAVSRKRRGLGAGLPLFAGGRSFGGRMSVAGASRGTAADACAAPSSSASRSHPAGKPGDRAR